MTSWGEALGNPPLSLPSGVAEPPEVVLWVLAEGLPPALGSASPAVLLMQLAIGLEGTWCKTRCCDTTLGSWVGEEGSGWHQSLNTSSLYPSNILGTWPPAMSSSLEKVPVNSTVLPCKFLPFDWGVLGSHWEQTHSWFGGRRDIAPWTWGCAWELRVAEGQVITQPPSSSPKCTQREGRDMEGTGWMQRVQMLLGCHCAPLLCDKWTIHPGLKAPCPRKEGRMAGRGARKNPSSQSNKGVNYLCSTDCFLRWLGCLSRV